MQYSGQLTVEGIKLKAQVQEVVAIAQNRIPYT